MIYQRVSDSAPAHQIIFFPQVFHIVRHCDITNSTLSLSQDETMTSRSDKEEEYFAKIEIEKKRQLLEEQQRALEESEKTRLKELHYMRCPKCGMELQEIEFRNVKIDKCVSCEGLWLDAGELEALTQMDKKVSGKILGIFKGQ